MRITYFLNNLQIYFNDVFIDTITTKCELYSTYVHSIVVTNTILFKEQDDTNDKNIAFIIIQCYHIPPPGTAPTSTYVSLKSSNIYGP